MVKVNKSDEIRSYAKANPKAGLTEIARALGEKGIKVTPAHVNQALKSAGMKAGKKTKSGRKPVGGKAKPVEIRATEPGGKFADAVMCARALVGLTGSVQEAIALLRAV
jgi:hypothetical protein